MRLHHLSMTAFGPYAGTVEVDFDALSSAGLFLLSGPTGSGKSSVLDGVCFALFGRVPGERQAAGHLRSDHADPEVAPAVVLEATIGGRRLRIERSPAWHRPKRRGTGTTLERARTLLQQRPGGGPGQEWEAITHRHDEAGEHLTGLLGMTLDQFLQVVLLPQGAFQTFLTADAQERQGLLERLFRTEVYDEIETRLAELRRAAATADRRHLLDVSRCLARLLEAAGSPGGPVVEPHDPAQTLAEHVDAGAPTGAAAAAAAAADPGPDPVPGDAHLDDLGRRADDGTLLAWGAGLLDRLRSHAETDRGTAAELADLAAEAETRVVDARDRARARHRGERARAALDVLAAESVGDDAAAERLVRARRAAPVAALVPAVETAREDVRTCEATLAGLMGRLEDVLAPDERIDDDALRRLRDRAQAAEEAARRVVEVHRERTEAQRRAAEVELRRERHAIERTALEVALADLPEALRGAEEQVTTAQALVAERDMLRVELDAAQERLGAVATATELRQELARADERLTAARAVRARADERLREVREARIAGMAAELALGLAAGGDCPVCGSHDHPRPAALAADHADEAAEALAQRELDDADITVTTVRDLRQGLRSRLEAAEASAGGADEADLVESIGALRDRAARAAAAETALPGLLARRDAALAQEARLRRDLDAAAVRSGADDALGVELADRLRALSDRLAALLHHDAPAEEDPHLVQDPSTAAARHAGHRDLLDATRVALRDLDRASTAARRAETRLETVAAEAGFDSVAEARASVLSDGEQRTVEARLAEHAERRAAAAAMLREPSVGAAMAAPADDLPALEVTAAKHTAAASAARREADRATERLERCDALVAELTAQLASWMPVRRRLALATAVAATADGRGDDNALRISLSAYVLAERLRQVVDAANDRLASMLPRYVLEHSETRSGRERRGGLGLRVLDQWSGGHRPAGTLSGGETFVVSLALALGLADVVTAESGAVDIGTLFVDEGFGSLDSETLDQVLDTLDMLREGGRVVGVVSHVAEMRERIPAQVRVRPLTRGSGLDVRTG